MSEIPQVQAADPVDAAEVAMRAVFHRDAALGMQKATFASDDLWAYGCQINSRHVGIIFAGDPNNMAVIHGGLWTACYRPRGEVAFWGEPEHVVCQQCLLEREEKVPLRVLKVPSPDPRIGLCFRIMPTWLQRFAHKQSRAALAKFLPQSESQSKEKPKEADARSRPTAPAV